MVTRLRHTARDTKGEGEVGVGEKTRGCTRQIGETWNETRGEDGNREGRQDTTRLGPGERGTQRQREPNRQENINQNNKLRNIKGINQY